jgi:hypothetical protein
MYSPLFFEMLVQYRSDEIAAVAERQRVGDEPVPPPESLLATLRNRLRAFGVRRESAGRLEPLNTTRAASLG